MDSVRSRHSMKRKRSQRGVAMVEYMEILVLAILGAAIAMAPLGSYFLRYYDNVEFVTSLPFP